MNSFLNLPQSVSALKLLRVKSKIVADDEVKKRTSEFIRYFTAGIKIDYETNEVILTGIDFRMLFKRVENLYSEKKLNHFLIKEYTPRSEKQYKKKRIKKSEMKIKAIRVPMFFALELALMFNDLGNAFGVGYYYKVHELLKEKTWISKLFEDVVEIPINTDKLSNIRYTLKDYQLDFVKAYKTLKDRFTLEGYLLSFDQGLGKTLTSIALAECLNKQQIIIVCPNSLKENWSYELREYFLKYSNIKTWRDEVFVINTPGYTYSKTKTKYLIVNMESISKIYPYVNKNKDTMIIVDEMHNFRNMGGKRTGELLTLKKLTNCKDNLLMSGTPIKAIPTEIIPSMLMIDPMFTLDIAKIYNRAFNIDSSGCKNLVNARFGMFMYRKTKDEVLSLPKKNLLPLIVDIKNADRYLVSEIKKQTNELCSQYLDEEMKKNSSYRDQYLYFIEKYSSATPAQTKQYIRYINKNINTGKEDYSKYHELDLEFFNSFPKIYVIPNIKDKEQLKTFNELYSKFVEMQRSCMGRAIGKILPPARTEMYKTMYLENRDKFIDMIVDNPRKTVIFSMMRGVIEFISKDLEENGIENVKIIGGVANRMDLIQQFKNSDSCNVLLATSQTLSTGVTLTEANQMFFFGTPWRSADYDQACDRIYRIGQTVDVNIYNVLLQSNGNNLSTRMNDILEWSGAMFEDMVETEALIETTELDQYIIKL